MKRNHKQSSLPFNKYGNSIIYYDVSAAKVVTKLDYDTRSKLATNNEFAVLRFDSCLEYEVYKILRCKFDKNDITHHFNIEILPKTDFDRALKWCVDFRVQPDNGLPFYVEAKGVETDDYSLRQRLLQRFKPIVFSRVMTVKKERLFDFAHRINVYELWSDENECNKY